jgi:hypothetical protein
VPELQSDAVRALRLTRCAVEAWSGGLQSSPRLPGLPMVCFAAGNSPRLRSSSHFYYLHTT